MPVRARDVKRWVREGLIEPNYGTKVYEAGWPASRTLWTGTVAGYHVQFCPNGREIDMSTLRVRALPETPAGGLK